MKVPNRSDHHKLAVTLNVMTVLSADQQRVVVASNLPLQQILRAYKLRFRIECMFRFLKCKGFRWEATLPVRCMFRVKKRPCPSGACSGSRSDPARQVHVQGQEATLPVRCMFRVKKRPCPSGACSGSRGDPARDGLGVTGLGSCGSRCTGVGSATNFGSVKTNSCDSRDCVLNGVPDFVQLLSQSTSI
jgi:hypothetical protein